MVRLLSMEDWTNLPLTKWNIKQPLLKEEREDAVETGVGCFYNHYKLIVLKYDLQVG